MSVLHYLHEKKIAPPPELFNYLLNSSQKKKVREWEEEKVWFYLGNSHNQIGKRNWRDDLEGTRGFGCGNDSLLLHCFGKCYFWIFFLSIPIFFPL